MSFLGVMDTFENARDADLITELAKTISGRKVLEIGCGGGERTAIFKKAGCQTTAVDLIDARKPNFISGYNFIIANGKNLLFNDETFDAVVSFDVIEHIDKDELFLNESSRVCKKRGIFILGTPNHNRLSNKLRQMYGKVISYPLRLGENCVHLREYTMNELVGLLEKLNFVVIRKNYVWFGLVGIGGFKRFPVFLNSWVQYLIVVAMKPQRN